MSETKSNPVVPSKAAPSREALKAKLSALETEAMKFAGNINFNPFLWCAKNLAGFQAQLKTSEPITADLIAKIEALKLPQIIKARE